MLAVPGMAAFLFAPGQPLAFSPQPAPSATTTANAESPDVRRFLEAMEFLGPMRFISISETSILETVAEVEAVSYKTMPDGTTMATLKSQDSCFEAHLRLERVARISMEAKQKDDRMIYAVRFVSHLHDEKPALVCLLHPDRDDGYDQSSLDYWEGLIDKYGPEIVLE